MTARNFLPASPMFDSIEIVRDLGPLTPERRLEIEQYVVKKRAARQPGSTWMIKDLLDAHDFLKEQLRLAKYRIAELELCDASRLKANGEVAALKAGQEQQLMLHRAECSGLEARIARHEKSEAEAWAKYRELKAEPRKCPKCGTNGDHYCPADVDTGETDPEEQ